ncbi:hypothetical protein EK21DRAFT_52772 [Setomelanomma holmii]|uniref:C2H2-type domain-containing protein n=1 Tax=Setomelanomma holmii TaxID=210430 RepID=A0A9P4HL37_9PLEO|nr:hypothetical protein EK21DRAFT_52772 [Setomelanomma holmii]
MAAQPHVQAETFKLVLEKFKASLSASERRRFGATTLQDLEIELQTIQLKQTSERKARAMSRLGRFLEGMKEYDKLVAVFLNTSQLLAFIWGPMKFLLQAYQRIGDHIHLLSQCETVFRQRPEMCHALRLVYEDILEFHWKAMKFFQKRVWQQLFRALWKTFEVEFGAILRNIRDHMSLVTSQATIAQFTEVLRTVELTKIVLQGQIENEKHRRREIVRQWLSAADCEADQETLASIRHEYPGTGEWLFKNDRFSSWFDSMHCATHQLWINGIPGAASLVVEKAQKEQAVTIIFFYCRYLDKDRSTFLGLARGLLSQLLLQDDSLLPYLYEKACTTGQRLSVEQVAREVLETSIKTNEKLYVVVDGLDECEREDRKQIVSFFDNVWTALPDDEKDSLRCLFLSQDDSTARKDFANMSSLKITEAHIRKDIRTYAVARVAEIKAKFDLSTDDQHLFQDLIVDKAEVSVDIDSQCVDWEGKRFRVNSKELCGSLVEIQTNGEVNLVHHTAKRYLVDQDFIDVGSGELTLAMLCVGYLSFPGFDPAIHSSEVCDFAPSGYYGFLDYAYAYWSRHMDAHLRLQKASNGLDELFEAAEVFVDMHGIAPQTKIVVPKSFSERWKATNQTRDPEKLMAAAYISQRQLNASAKQEAEDHVLGLHVTVQQVRKCLEEMCLSNKSERFRSAYGTEIFKCPRVNCTRFYNGFRTEQEREEHVPKHERSFFCTFAGCAMAKLGCATLKDLQRHENEYHGSFTLEDGEPEYPEMPPERVSFKCAVCNAEFTRNNNLKIHMRKHSAPNEKSFICSRCGQSFARLGDRTRHESTKHSSAKTFTCGGLLKDGTKWGCGREFDRGDTLSRHWKGEKGKMCISVKKQEEETENASTSASVHPSNASTPGA